MVHDLDLYAFALPAIDEWLAGDDRTLAFQVSDDSGTGIDISEATVAWHLFDRPYVSDPAEAVIGGDDDGVEIVTDSRVDTTVGEFEVRIAGDATSDLYGAFTHRPVVTQADGSRASWRGEAILTA
jgi:hypothetical protein